MIRVLVIRLWCFLWDIAKDCLFLLLFLCWISLCCGVLVRIALCGNMVNDNIILSG
jgi:hypothetical protein